MPDVVFSVDQSKSMRDQAVPGHNRWHPDNPSAASVQPGSEFRVECREWTDAQLGNNDSANDVRDVDLTHAHMLSGPIEIQGAEPGDLLVVDILDLGPVPQETGPAPGQGWGYTGIFAKTNAGGFLTDYYPDAYKAIWDFHGQEATSRHLPGIRYTGITHPGLFGTAPSAELLAKWNERERALIATDPDRVPPLALPPLEENTLAGTLTGDALAKVAREGARTVPARENGGNHDIKNFTRGSARLLPGARRRGQAVRRRPPLQPGGRRDHLLRRDRDGRLHRLRRRPDQGRHGQVRGQHQPDLHARQRRAALQRVHQLRRRLGRPRHQHQLLHERHPGLQAGLPERHRVPQDLRLLRRAGLPAARLGPDRGPDQRHRRHPQRLRARCTCRPRSSTSTSDPPPRAPGRPTGGSAR